MPRSTTVIKFFRQNSEVSHELSITGANPHQESGVPLQPPGYFLDKETRTPLEINPIPNSIPPGNHEDDKTPQELPPNHAPLPEIASSVRTFHSRYCLSGASLESQDRIRDYNHLCTPEKCLISQIPTSNDWCWFQNLHRTHPSRATNFRHLILPLRSTPIRQPRNPVSLASGHTPSLACPQLRIPMDSPLGLTLPPDSLWCLLLINRPH